MSQYHLRWARLASLASLFAIAIAPQSAQANFRLTHAEVITFRNRVELLLSGDLTRPLRVQDRLGFGDAIRTERSSQADLRFNDGSVVRVGEQTLFWFVSNQREFRLTQGTVLLIAATDAGSSAIATPNTVATTQGSTVVVRHVPIEPSEADERWQPGTGADFPETVGRTAVMVISEGDGAAVQVSLRDGRSVDITAGQMAIVDDDNLYIFEFDLALFFETSPLIQDFSGGDADAVDSDQFPALLPPDLTSQTEFEGDYWLDPKFLSPHGDAIIDGGWLFPTATQESSDPANDTRTDDAGTEMETSEPETSTNEVSPTRGHEASEIETQLTPPATEAPSSIPDSEESGGPPSEEEPPPAGVLTAPDSNESPAAE